jgi:hypothetical protein
MSMIGDTRVDSVNTWRCSRSHRRRLLGRHALHLESLESRTLLAADPIINEILADNVDGIRDGYDNRSDWMELFNAGDEGVDLAGWYLSDDPANLTKWQFPDAPASELAAREFLVVFASGDSPTSIDPAGNLHASFRLSTAGERILLVRPDGVTIQSQMLADGTAYPAQYSDVSYGPGSETTVANWIADGAAVDLIVPTAATDAAYGTSWRGGDETAFQSAGGLADWTSGETGVGYDTNIDYQGSIRSDVLDTMFNVNTSVYLRIPFEVSDSRSVTQLKLSMLYDDGFVAYLNGQEIVRQFVAGEPVWNTTATTDNHEADAFEEFDVSASAGALREGTNILAIHGANRTVDSSDFLILPRLTATMVTGVTGTGYLPIPTPGQPNSRSYEGLVGDTQFSIDRGIYDAPLDVVISSDTPGSTIVYTTDGSTPSATNGVQVPAPNAATGPAATVHIDGMTTLRAIAIKPGFFSSNVDTQTYLFLRDVADQLGVPAGYPATWGGVSADYDVDPDVTGNPLYEQTFVNDLKSVPIVSLVTDAANLFDSTTGIYVNSLQSGVTWERPVSVELLNFEGLDPFQVDAGVRIFGGVSRQLDRTPKKSFRLQFKSIYGASKLEFPFFEDSTVNEFDRLMLRGGYNYKWTHADATQQARADYMRDQFSRLSHLDMGETAAHGRYVQVFVNGMYWGMYNAVERPDDSFAASYLGGESEDYDAIKHGTPPEATQGDRVAWDAMFAIAKDPNRSPSEKYSDIQEYLDIDSLIDYMIMIHFAGNVDAPVIIGATEGPRNFYAARPRVEGGQFKFFLWDSEHTLSEPTVDRTEIGVGNADDTPARLFGELRSSPEFRLRFADHVQQHFFNDGALTTENNIARYLSIAQEIDRAIVGESARWGDVRRATPYTRDVEWLAEQNRLVTQFFPARNSIVLNQWRADGLFPATIAPLLSQHGGTFVESLDLSLSAPAGAIYFTLDGSDPRNAATNQPGLSAQLWSGVPIVLTDSANVRARVLNSGTWSPVTTATFVRDVPPPLRITELMYHPADDPQGTAGDWEFIEVQNISDQPLNVRGFQFTNGVDFTFPDAVLSPGERAVIAGSQSDFVSRYGASARVIGEYSGQLSNSGETLRLAGRVGETIQEFSFSDGWYPVTDGEGYSLVIRNAQGSLADWNRSAGWQPSELIHGSPGSEDAAIPPGAIVLNEVLATANSAEGNWIELKNTTSTTIDVSGWHLSSDSSGVGSYTIPAGTQIAAGGYLVLYQNTSFGVGAAGFSLNSAAGELRLASRGSAQGIGGYREVLEYDGALPGQSYGIHVNSENNEDVVPLLSATPGASNSLPFVGNVVIHEVMYNPADTRPEFIEIYNRSNTVVPLYDAAVPENTWSFTNGVDFAFPAGLELAPGAFLVIAASTPEVFRQAYQLGDEVPVLGPYAGSLNNAGERVTLSMPIGTAPGGAIPRVPVDQVRYRPTSPWPERADGAGASLNRTVISSYGSDPLHWGAGRSGGTPGTANVLLDATPPTVPIALRALRTADTTVQISWDAARDAQSGVAEYRIYLDNQRIGSTTTTQFQHVTTPGMASYGYQVSAVNGDGFESARSAFLGTAQIELEPLDDTYLGSSQSSETYGDVRVLVADYDATNPDRQRRMLLKWDLSEVESHLSVLDAAVTLQVTSAPVDHEYLLYELRKDWDPAMASWTVASSGNAWQESGANGAQDRGFVVLGRATPSGTGAMTLELNAAGVQVVENWISGASPNHGFLLTDAQDQGAAQADLPPVPPVIHWKFDGNLQNSGSGGTALNATVLGGPATFTAGEDGQALDLQNSLVAGTGTTATSGGQYVSVNYALPDQGSISLWYYAEPFYNFQTIFDNSVQQDDWEMWIYSDGRIRARVDNNSGQITDNLAVRGGAGNWYHIVYTWDRNDTTATAADLYVNGSLAGSDDIPAWVVPGNQFFLGGGNDGNTYATGNFDDVRIYDYELSASNVEALFGGSSEEPVLTTDLVSYWNLDDGVFDPGAAIAADSVGDNDGVVANFDGPPSWLGPNAGKVGGALHFGGGGEHVYVANSPSLNIPTNAVSVAAWVNLELLPAQLPESFGSIYDSNEDSYVLYQDRGANELRFKVTDADGSAERPGIPASMLRVGQWHLVVGVYDGNGQQAKIYLDGQLVDTHTNAALTGVVRPGQIAAIGRNGASTASAFRGDIDEVAIWSRALSDLDIAALWNGGAGVALLQTSNTPVLHWPLDGDLTNLGSSGGENNGTLVDGAQGDATYVSTALDRGLHLTNSGSTNGAYAQSAYTLTDRGTIAFWYTPDNFGLGQTLFDTTVDADRWKIAVAADGMLQFQMDSGVNPLSYDLQQLGGPHQTYHIAVTWDRSNTTDSALRLVVNGTVVDSNSISGWVAPGTGFYLGGGNNGNLNGNGVWDDFRIYDAPLDIVSLRALIGSTPIDQPLVVHSSDANSSDLRPTLRVTFNVPAAIIGDFNADGDLSCDDINLLVAQIGTFNPPFDLNGDQLVDGADVRHWAMSLKGVLPGDANLDGFVDAQDLTIWESSKFSLSHAWCAGDWSGDGAIDGTDFNLWYHHRFTASGSPVAAQRAHPRQALRDVTTLDAVLMHESQETPLGGTLGRQAATTVEAARTWEIALDRYWAIAGQRDRGAAWHRRDGWMKSSATNARAAQPRREVEHLPYLPSQTRINTTPSDSELDL